MKKILTIALVALLAASTAFAGFSGKATLSLGYDTESKEYGFVNGDSFSVDLDLATESAEKAGEGDIYAGVKASLALKIIDSNYQPLYVKDYTGRGMGIVFSLDEAYVAGEDWKVAITGTQDGPDFATSAIDVYYKLSKDALGFYKTGYYWNYSQKATTYAVSTNKAPGVTVSYKDWSVAAGFNGGEADEETGAPKFFNYHVSAFTPSFTLADGLTTKVAAVASGIKNATNSDIKINDVAQYDESKNYDAFGASAEIAYASDAFSGKLDADFGMKKTVGTDKFVPGLDIAANAVVSGFTVDAYYQYGEEVQFISAKVAADLNTFEVPVVLTVYGKDVANKEKGQTFGGKAESTLDAFTLAANGSYTLSSKKLALGGSVEYKAEKYTAKAGLNFSKVLEEDGAKQLYANASVESDVLVPGATLALEYGPNENIWTGDVVTNYLAEEATFGYVSASCTIKF